MCFLTLTIMPLLVLQMSNCLFIDFYDSFSLNILAHFKKVHINFEHIYYDDSKIVDKLNSKKFQIICLGPGPGHIKDYDFFINSLRNSYNTNKFYLGVCLGHQILGHLHGFELFKMSRPYHGEAIEVDLASTFNFSNNKQFVQFYNSWALRPKSKSDKLKQSVMALGSDNIVMSLSGTRMLTMQFHPESIGTSCPDAIFSDIKDFLYTSMHGVKNSI